MQEKAFPNPHLTHETGMTIRDYFAAKAMQGMMSKTDFDAYYGDVAKWSYELADAMLKAREQ
jgi:hypothetical protein